MKTIRFRVGALQSISSLYFNVKDDLREFNVAWVEGKKPEVIWDMTDLRPGKMNVSALSFFLALAHRMRMFMNEPQPILIDWNPNVLQFLEDIRFLAVSKQFDLFKWPDVLGGYETGNGNPNNRIIAYDKLSLIPSFQENDLISEWKKLHREKYRSHLMSSCQSLFEHTNIERGLPLLISRNCAEVAVNSLLWGGSAAFIGLQRASKYIFVSVSDIGVGFSASYNCKNFLDIAGDGHERDIISLLNCSVLNANDLGLKRLISSVIDLGGNVTLSSGNAELSWKKEFWIGFLNDISELGLDKAIFKAKNFGARLDPERKETGFSRILPQSIRGARVSFVIPLGEAN